MKVQRKKFKNKWKCRSYTYNILFPTIKVKIIRRRKPILIKYKCKKCSATDKLQIHHEIYPITKKGIIKAIKEGKIYFLCRKHHKH